MRRYTGGPNIQSEAKARATPDPHLATQVILALTRLSGGALTYLILIVLFSTDVIHGGTYKRRFR